MTDLAKTQCDRVRIVDGFVFRTLFGNRPDLCQTLLELVLNKQMETVSIVHHDYVHFLPELRGGRIDLLALDECGHRYDVEIRAIADFYRRDWIELHQALIDVNFPLDDFQGMDQCDSVVIFVCDFDPLGEGKKLYELHGLHGDTADVLEDRYYAFVLNARGTQASANPQLDAFLQFVAGEEVIEDPFVNLMRDALDPLVSDSNWIASYELLREEQLSLRTCALKKGYEDGYNKGCADVLQTVKSTARALMERRCDSEFDDTTSDDASQLLVSEPILCVSQA